MKIGDLLILKEEYQVEGEKQGLIVVIDIDEHPNSSQRDRIHLQWMPLTGGNPIKGVFSRVIVEKRYRVI